MKSKNPKNLYILIKKGPSLLQTYNTVYTLQFNFFLKQALKHLLQLGTCSSADWKLFHCDADRAAIKKKFEEKNFGDKQHSARQKCHW